MTADAVDASRPVVGSSRKRTSGDVINSIPIEVRFLSPPEMPRISSSPTYEYPRMFNFIGFKGKHR